MKIRKPPKLDSKKAEQFRQDLLRLLDQPSDKEIRPCSECRIPCKTHGLTTCTCECSVSCPQIGEKMSSDPENYPVEPSITNLVYSFNTLRVCVPCWSCEGHYLPDTFEISKLPRVWFYSDSSLYPKLIFEHLTYLKAKRKIHFEWHLTVSYSNSPLETAFSVEPKLLVTNDFDLEKLRADSREIGLTLREGIHDIARRYLSEIDSINN